MPYPFLDADSLTTSSNNNNTRHRRRRRQLSGNTLISQADLISSSSSTRSIINDHANNTPPLTADGYSNKKNNNRKKNFTTASFRSLGCTASSQVSVPASIRSSANWEAKKVRKKNQNRNNPTATTTIDDVWCVPAVALSATTDTAASFDRLKLDVDKKKKKTKNMNLRKGQRSSSSSSTRRMMNQEAVIFQGSNYGFGMPHHGLDEFRPRSFHHHVRRSPSPEGLSEIVMIQDRRLTGARIGIGGLDRYQEWRLNVDDMSYEELLELGEKIGHVNTGLREEEMVQCLRKMKISSGGRQEEDLLANPTTESSHSNCSICQEEYGEEDETGELDCGHFFHSHCIEQWLVRKNRCPICKTAAIAE